MDVTVNLESVKQGLLDKIPGIVAGMRETGASEEAIAARVGREAARRERDLLAAFTESYNAASREFERGKTPGASMYPLPPDISLLFRRGDYPRGGAPAWVEECHYDTVAVAVVDSTLYIACNYKKRVPGRVRYEPHIRYDRFGFPGKEKLDDLYAALTREFMEVHFPRITKLVFLRPREVVGFEEASGERLEALPHAEMQLVSFLRHIGKPRWIGVSKPCCAKCARGLRAAGIGYLSDMDTEFDNWVPPELIRMEVLKEYHVCWLRRVLRLRGG